MKIPIVNSIRINLLSQSIFILSQDFVKVANTSDVLPSDKKEFEVDGQKICIINIDGRYYAIGSICTHEGGPLADVLFQAMKLNVLGMVQNLI